MRMLLVPRAGIEPARLAARDFESRASTYSAISATQATIMTETKYFCKQLPRFCCVSIGDYVR